MTGWFFVIPKVLNSYEFIILIIPTIIEFNMHVKGCNVVGIFPRQFETIWTFWMQI
jgi:hypothetical protein